MRTLAVWPRLVVVAVGGLTGLAASRLTTPDLAPAIPLLLLAAAGIALATWYNPSGALFAVVVLLPFQDLVLALLYRAGIDAGVLALSRFWKETILAALVLRWVTQPNAARDTLDYLTFAFLAAVGLYVALPLGPSPYVRVIAARQDAAFLLLFLVVRHVDLRPGFRERIESAILTVGSIVAAVGLWNLLSPHTFVRFVQSIGLGAYHTAVFGEPMLLVRQTLLAGREFVRAGSIFFDPVTLAYYLVIAVAVAVAQLSSRRSNSWQLGAGILCTAGVVATLTRSAIAGLALMFAVAMTAGRRRERLWIGLVIGVVALWPLWSQLSVEQQLRAGLDPNDARVAGHIGALSASRERLLDRPMGTGLGTAARVAQRFDVPGSITNESWYFQIGTEVGVLPMLLFVWVVVQVLRMQWSLRLTHDQTLAGLYGLIVIALGGLVVHTFDTLAVAWTIWVVSGLGLRPQDAPGPIRDE